MALASAARIEPPGSCAIGSPAARARCSAALSIDVCGSIVNFYRPPASEERVEMRRRGVNGGQGVLHRVAMKCPGPDFAANAIPYTSYGTPAGTPPRGAHDLLARNLPDPGEPPMPRLEC